MILYKRFFLLLLCSLSAFCSFGNNAVDSLLKVFDHDLANSRNYIAQREKRIAVLEHESANKSLTLERKYDLYQELYREYRPYQCDSAIACMNRCINLAQIAENQYWYDESCITLAYLLASVGSYRESTDMLSEVNRSTLSDSLLLSYFDCMDHLYGEAAVYSKTPSRSNVYRQLSNSYQDSIRQIVAYGSDMYWDLEEAHNLNSNNLSAAMDINDIRLSMTTTNTPQYAMLCYNRSLIFKKKGDWEKEKEWLLRSAIADLHLGITDNGSSWNLAAIMYEEGDIVRANNYISYAVENSNIYNARLRLMQIGYIQSIIAQAYQLLREEQQKKMRLYLILISILSVLLMSAVIGIYIQNKRLSSAHEKTTFVNSQLHELNIELNRINKQQKETNFALLESNHVKEEYIGHFLSLCSSYIDKIDGYRRDIHKKLQGGQTDTLLKMTQSPEFLDKEIENFYVNFDTTFLHLYPDFVKEFNDLLLEDERIVLKKGELLNTELRIFALIRLGIDNSAKIAELLRYSANTIYNYRAKIKNKANGSRDDFENRVMKIGTFTK